MTRTEIPFNILVLFVVVTLAAILQDGLPPLPWGGVKAPFLIGVAAYYALRRPWPLALPAIVWSGLLLDGLSSLPGGGTGLAAMLALAAFCAAWGRKQLPENILSCLVVGSVTTGLLTLIEYVVLRLRGDLPALAVSFVLLRVVISFIYAVPVCAAVAAVAGVLDRLALNVRTEKNAAGFDWSSDSV